MTTDTRAARYFEFSNLSNSTRFRDFSYRSRGASTAWVQSGHWSLVGHRLAVACIETLVAAAGNEEPSRRRPFDYILRITEPYWKACGGSANETVSAVGPSSGRTACADQWRTSFDRRVARVTKVTLSVGRSERVTGQLDTPPRWYVANSRDGPNSEWCLCNFSSVPRYAKVRATPGACVTGVVSRKLGCKSLLHCSLSTT